MFKEYYYKRERYAFFWCFECTYILPISKNKRWRKKSGGEKRNKQNSTGDGDRDDENADLSAPTMSKLTTAQSQTHEHEQEEENNEERSGVGDALGASAIASDGVSCVFGGQDESVYAAVWSPADCWIAAALAHDGRLTLHRVPTQEKLRILLWFSD